MLKNNFFRIEKSDVIYPNELKVTVKINPDHEIFKGHFPGQPVVPGVVSVQMINELLSDHLEKPLMMTSAKSIKYISMIDPTIHSILNYSIKFSETETNIYKVESQISFDDTIFVKFNGTFSVMHEGN